MTGDDLGFSDIVRYAIRRRRLSVRRVAAKSGILDYRLQLVIDDDEHASTFTAEERLRLYQVLGLNTAALEQLVIDTMPLERDYIHPRVEFATMMEMRRILKQDSRFRKDSLHDRHARGECVTEMQKRTRLLIKLGVKNHRQLAKRLGIRSIPAKLLYRAVLVKLQYEKEYRRSTPRKRQNSSLRPSALVRARSRALLEQPEPLFAIRSSPSTRTPQQEHP